ncbi:glycosyltransferase family 4 protein [Streptococcus suis]
MRILFISPVGALFSGAEVSILNLMEYLSKNGHHIYNVIPDNETNADSTYLSRMQVANIKYYSMRSLCWWWLESKNIPEADRTAVLLYQHKNIADIRQIIREEAIDLVISNTVHVFQGAIAAALENCRHYYLIHEFPKGEFEYYKEKIPVINLLSDKIFAVHGGLYEELSSYFSSDKLSSFIPYSQVDEQKLKTGSRTRIVSIGGISEWKNQLELIKAFAKLQSTYDLELVFIGGWDNEYKAICDCYISENSIRNVQFLGYQENPWSFVTDRDIVVFPSKFEAFPLVLVEAILNGVPYIASDNLGYHTVGKFFETENFYSLGEVEDLVEKIKNTLENYEHCKDEALLLSAVAQRKYTIFEASKNIIDSINGDFFPLKTKKLQGISSLLGVSIAEDMLMYIEQQKITVYYSNEKNEFSAADSFVLPLLNEGEFTINTGIAKKIRVDLSESFGSFEYTSLKTVDDAIELTPIFVSGIELNGGNVFAEEDPQLIYDVSELSDRKLVFRYKRKDVSATPKQLCELLNEEIIINKSKEMELGKLQENFKQLELAYEQLSNDYHMVIGSRRWTIPTKIINFFRRKK